MMIPALLRPWWWRSAPVVGQQCLRYVAFTPPGFCLLGYQRVQIGEICIPTFLALDGNCNFCPSIAESLSLVTPGIEEMMAHFLYFVYHGVSPFDVYA